MKGGIAAGRRVFVGLLFFLTTAALIWLAAGESNPGEQGTPGGLQVHKQTNEDVSAIKELSTLQRARFVLFQSPVDPALGVVAFLKRDTTFGLNPMLAQAVPENAPGTYWLVPGNRSLCVVSQTDQHAVGMTCQSINQAARQGVATIVLRESKSGTGKRIIVGVAPRGVKEMVIDTRGSSQVVPVNYLGAFVHQDNNLNPPNAIHPKNRLRHRD